MNTERNKVLERAMELAQVFASSWAFFGGPFDHGDGAERAEEAKDELRKFLQSAIASPVAQPQDEREALYIAFTDGGKHIRFWTRNPDRAAEWAAEENREVKRYVAAMQAQGANTQSNSKGGDE